MHCLYPEMLDAVAAWAGQFAAEDVVATVHGPPFRPDSASVTVRLGCAAACEAVVTLYVNGYCDLVFAERSSGSLLWRGHEVLNGPEAVAGHLDAIVARLRAYVSPAAAPPSP